MAASGPWQRTTVLATKELYSICVYPLLGPSVQHVFQHCIAEV
jgi:hypothetical protein